MGKFIIDGGYPLRGKVTVSGSKNAALPIIFATLATVGVSEITALPDIEDVRVALDLVKELGAVAERCGDVTYIDTEHLRYVPSNVDLVGKIRASTYLLSGKLAGFSKAEVMDFGGCNFSPRPIDMHISAFESFGAVVNGNIISSEKAHGAVIDFKKKSVGATVNALIYASSIPYESVINGCAREPHIDTLITFLRSAGAKIYVTGDSVRVIGNRLSGGRVRIPGDEIEAGTYLAASIATGGDVTVYGVSASDMIPFVEPLLHVGCTALEHEGGISLHGLPKGALNVVARPYPGFPTDLQPIIAPIISLGEGGTITDTVWPERFGYLSELCKMGLGYEQHGNEAIILKGKFYSAKVNARDLRGGAACLIAAMAADGTSVISNGGVLMRGYGSPIEKLSALGAKIKYLEI